jgi:hypothetical protein
MVISMTIQDRIESLGGLHDAIILSLAWSAEERCLRIVVDDINSNTFGLPEDPGPRSATLVFSEVTCLDVNANLTVAGLMVYDWTITSKGPDTYASSLMLSPGGKLTIECRSIEIVEG